MLATSLLRSRSFPPPLPVGTILGTSLGRVGVGHGAIALWTSPAARSCNSELGQMRHSVKNQHTIQRAVTSMDLVSVSADELRHLQVWNRSVRLENLNALTRRWRLAQTGALETMRLTERLFPGQRNLLDLLAVCSEEEVAQMADCATALFGLKLRCTEFMLGNAGSQAVDPIEAESFEESFVALAARLDAVRTDTEQARIVFSLTKAEALWLSRYCPHELYALARDPSMVLTQVVHWDYFVASMTRSLNREQRTLFSAVSRRSPSTAAVM